MAAVPNACYAATNTYANIHKKLVIQTSDEVTTPPSSPARNGSISPNGGPSSPAKWISSALNYFQFNGRPRSESNPESRSTLPVYRMNNSESPEFVDNKSTPISPLTTDLSHQDSRS